MSQLSNFVLEKALTEGVGVTCYDFGYRRVAGVPGLHPIHILGEVKKHTHSFTSNSKNCSHSYTSWVKKIIDIRLK